MFREIVLIIISAIVGGLIVHLHQEYVKRRIVKMFPINLDELNNGDSDFYVQAFDVSLDDFKDIVGDEKYEAFMKKIEEEDGRDAGDDSI